MNKTRTLLTCLAATLLLSVILSTGINRLLAPSSKVHFIDLEKVYKEFKMKGDMEKEAEGLLKERQLLLDSLVTDLQSREQVIKSGASPAEKAGFERDKAEYFRKQEYFQNSGQQIIQEFNKKLWAEIQKQAEGFARENGIKMILGKGSDQAFVYGSEKLDCTLTFIEYLNKEYAGKKK